jgi:hypothetical protein
MEITQFDTAFKSAITEIRLIDARLGVLSGLIEKAKTSIIEDPRIGVEMIGAGFPFRDITLDVGVDNLFMPTDEYVLSRLNFEEEINLILSRVSMLQVAQAYEVTETYLYNQSAEYIRLNDNLLLPDEFLPKTQSFADIRLALKGLNGRTNNRHLLNILRTNNRVFQQHESRNVYSTDFRKWFEMFSVVRHTITHQRMHTNKPINKSLKANFDKYFSIQQVNDERVMYTSVNATKEFLHILAGYMFFIYKAVVDVTQGCETSFETISHVFHDPYNNRKIEELHQ